MKQLKNVVHIYIYQKETHAQVFSCELCETLQSSFFKEIV